MKAAKKLTAIALALIIALTIFPLTSLYANSRITVIANGEEIAFQGQGPVIIDGRVLVPVRGVFEALGFEVDWDGDARVATITRGRDVIIITIGSATFTTNGIAHNLDVPAQIIDGRTLVPIRFPLESVGYNVSWDSQARTARITSGQGITLTQAAYALSVYSANGTQMRHPTYVFAGDVFTLVYDTLSEFTLSGTTGWNVESSNPDVVWVESSLGTSQRRLRTNVLQAGTTTVTLTGRGGRDSDELTITATPAYVTATADHTGVHLSGAFRLTQNEIQSILPFARPPEGRATLPSTCDFVCFFSMYAAGAITEWEDNLRNSATHPHPNRAMTDQELQEWIDRYNRDGGLNALELEILYLINDFRAEHGLEPLRLCPYLSMTGRLTAQMSRDGIRPEARFANNITDPFYGRTRARALLFREVGAIDSMNTLFPIWEAGDAVFNWTYPYNSSHDLLLSEDIQSIGIGGTSVLVEVVIVRQ